MPKQSSPAKEHAHAGREDWFGLMLCGLLAEPDAAKDRRPASSKQKAKTSETQRRSERPSSRLRRRAR